MTRYDRQIRLNGFGPEGQESLGKARVLVVGAGGLGVPACQYLAAMGVGLLGIADADRVELTNLHRQPAYTPEDCGSLKVEVLTKHLRIQNPEITVVQHPVFVTPENVLELLQAYDLVVDATDRIATRYLLDDACVIRGIPWVYGALHGFEGQISVFNYESGPTYRCLYPTIPKRGEIPDCNLLGTLGVLPGIIGTLQALEAVKALCGIGRITSGRLLLYNALDQEMQTIHFNKKSAEARTIQSMEAYAPTGCRAGSRIPLEEYCSDIYERQPHVLVDVREPAEFESGHAPQALNIPLMDLDAGRPELRNAPDIYLICQTGNRSAQGCQKLEAVLTEANVYWIDGGMADWNP